MLLFRTTRSGNHELTTDKLAVSCPSPLGGSGPCEELYRYDDRDGSLECVSCDHGGETTSSFGVRGEGASFKLSADGETVAFVTAQALAPHELDINKGSDLYEWRAGAQRLITDGVSGFGQGGTATLQPYALSANGRDVFFKVVDPGLTGFEQDRLANLYDARIGGGFTPPSPHEQCEVLSDTCQGPLGTPPFAALPGSALVFGAGNVSAPLQPAVKPKGKALTRAQKLAAALRACRKKARGKRASCERQARKRYAPIKAKKAAKARRGRR